MHSFLVSKCVHVCISVQFYCSIYVHWLRFFFYLYKQPIFFSLSLSPFFFSLVLDLSFFFLSCFIHKKMCEQNILKTEIVQTYLSIDIKYLFFDYFMYSLNMSIDDQLNLYLYDYISRIMMIENIK